MRTNLYLKSSAELLADVETRLTDSANELASEAQYKVAINEAIQMWGGRVVVPRIYDFTSGFSAGTYEYTLPSYIRRPFKVQIKSTAYNFMQGQQVENETNYTWHDVVSYSVEPNGSGGYKIRLEMGPYSEDARIIWYSENGPLPTTNPTVTSNITAASTSIALTVTSAPDVGQSGFFKIENEWISYGDITRTSSTSYTATGCLRGLYGTTADSHSSSTAVYWGVAVDDQRLWVQMLDYIAAYIHAMQLHKSTVEDMGRHEKLMSYFQQKADGFWRQSGYVSQRNGRTILTAGSIGAIAW